MSQGGTWGTPDQFYEQLGEKMGGMGIPVARLRMVLVVGVVLLAAVVAGFLGYARYRSHRFLAGLPGRLGIDIRRETNGYTYSQSVGGKTVMTLHAAKAVEHTDGKITLHDVSMVLYGRKQDRQDQISGSEFEYEQASGVVRAVGEVHIDLQAPTKSPEERSKAAAAPLQAGHMDLPERDGKRLIHVKTSGLVYLQKLGVAATDQPLEFRFGALTGHAVGAEYNSDTGIVILQSAVKANGLERGTPVVLTAAHAELDRPGQRALLTEARYASPGQMVRGDHAVVHLREDGTPQRIEAEGNVVLERPGAGQVTAPRADVLLNAAGQAQDAHLFGGVRYAETTSLREGRGEAQDARVSFNEAGEPQRVVLTGAVHVNERVRTVDMGWSTRDVVAGAMTVALAPDGKQRQLREAEATTAARVVLVSDAGTPRESRSELAGDRLRGEFVGAGKGMQLTKLHGSGHTALRRVALMGAEQTSVGDTLEVSLQPSTVRGKAGTEQVARAEQTGHVTLTSRAAAEPGAKAPPAVERASAEVAVYDGDADRLTLTGHAQVVDLQGTVAAGTMVLEQASGNATASGTVKATYVQTDAGTATEPVHVLADHAEVQHDARRAVFHGVAGGRPARMWQGASQVEAPVLDLEQEVGRLTAHGESGGGAAPVHAVLVGPGPADGKKEQALPSVVRVASRTMVYLDAARQLDFSGGVKVEDADGTLRAEQATAYLAKKAGMGTSAPKNAPGASKQPQVMFGGSVDHIVATGKVELEQPGRRGSGERLVYTAGDGLFVLTGTAGAPPRLVDQAQGTVTGRELRFHSGDKSAVVTSGDAAQAGQAAQRVHTVTRVKQP